MIQLKVYPNSPKVAADAVFLDLYETQPIKLTLSIEDITSAEATSVFSRTFKVPATAANADFFENAFLIQGVTYDITVKKPAEILVDGQEFREGHIRLQKIFINGDQDKIDYELLFLGETRDFSSSVAEKQMCALTMTDFEWEGLPVNYTDSADYADIPDSTKAIASWQAYPEGADETTGVANGNLLFPLIDHGNEYSTVDPEDLATGFHTISVGNPESFTNNGNDIPATRLKPMIRAKRLWDQIFEDAGYTYQSDFLDSLRFKSMYVSAFGNVEQTQSQADGVNTEVFAVFEPGANGNNDVESYGYFSQISIPDATGNYTINIPDTGSQTGGSFFTAPSSASTSGGAYYAFEGGARVDAQLEDSNQGTTPVLCRMNLVIVDGTAPGVDAVLATGNWNSNGGWSSFQYDSRNGGYQPQAGDVFKTYIEAEFSFDESQVGQAYWHCNVAPGDWYPLRDLDCEYNQIDYVRDVITMFRLVMQPDPSRPNHFIIEPWQEFIGSGDTFDWTDKLDNQKDFIAEPVFNTQSAQIEFTMSEEEDLINKFHQDNNKHAYGWLRFNSQNELLKGKREIEVAGIAPTPVDQINHGANANHPYPQWILPTIIEVTGENFQRLPIKAKTRFLFYNGLQPITVSQDYWYLSDGSQQGAAQSSWPLVSSYENWPPQQVGLNLNFSNDTRYYTDPDPGVGYYDQGQTLFDDYWARYITTLYNKFSRRVTANFILDNTDLQNLSFDDLIFVNGVYYRPEKISNAEVGNKTSVKCELITVLDARPNWRDETLDNVSILGVAPPCSDGLGSISISQSGTPPLLAELDNGQSATFNAPAGQAPYNWSMSGVSPGVYEITLTDGLNRQWIQTIEVPVSTATPVSFGLGITNPTDCDAPCNGSILVTPSGGTGSYTILWDDGSQNLSRATLCPGSYSFTLSDTNGCSIEGNALLECNAPPSEDQYIAQLLTPNANPVLIGNMFTNPDINGTNNFHQAFSVASDYVNYPQYNFQFNEFEPWYMGANPPYAYIRRSDPNVINDSPNVGGSGNVPYFVGGSRVFKIPVGWVGTVRLEYDLELTNVQGIDLSGDEFYWQVFISGSTYTNIPVPTLPTNGTVVPFQDSFEYYSDGTETVEISILFRYRDLGVPSPAGPIIGYRGTFQWFDVEPCELEIPEYSIKSSNTPLNIGDVITLAELSGCYEITDTTADIAVANFQALFDNCEDCYDNIPPQMNSWKVELYDGICDETGTYVYVDEGTFTPTAGQFARLVNNPNACYKFIEQSVNLSTDTVSAIFKDCPECGNTLNGYPYQIIRCLGGGIIDASSSVNTLLIGSIYEMQAGPYAGECVEVVATGGLGGDLIDHTLNYRDCLACQGISPSNEYASNRSEGNGHFNVFCAVDTIFPIFTNSLAPTPDLVPPGSRMFVDAALTNPWDGNNLYYSCAEFAGTNNSTAVLQIDSNGYVTDNIIC